MPGFVRILIRHLTVFRRTWRSNVMFSFVEPLLYLSALGYGLGSFVSSIDGLSYAEFFAPGIVVSASIFAGSFECTYGSFIRLHYHKTYHAMLAAPILVRDVVLADILFGALKGVLFGSVILFVITLTGQNQSLYSLLIPLFLVLPGLLFSAVAMCYTAITPNIDNFNYYITLFITPLYLFSGIFFPANSLPAWAQAVVWLNPVFHSAEVCRALALGFLSPGLWWHAVILAGLCFLFIPVAVKLMERKIIV